MAGVNADSLSAHAISNYFHISLSAAQMLVQSFSELGAISLSQFPDFLAFLSQVEVEYRAHILSGSEVMYSTQVFEALCVLFSDTVSQNQYNVISRLVNKYQVNNRVNGITSSQFLELCALIRYAEYYKR